MQSDENKNSESGLNSPQEQIGEFHSGTVRPSRKILELLEEDSGVSRGVYKRGPKKAENRKRIVIHNDVYYGDTYDVESDSHFTSVDMKAQAQNIEKKAKTTTAIAVVPMDSVPKKKKNRHMSKWILATAVICISAMGVGYAARNGLPNFHLSDSSGAQFSQKNAVTATEQEKPVYGLYVGENLVHAAYSEDELNQALDLVIAPYRELEESGELSDLDFSTETEIKLLEDAKIGSKTDLSVVTYSGGEVVMADSVEELAQNLFYGEAPREHVVTAGQTASTIAEANGIDLTTLMVANPKLLADPNVKEGQTLQLSTLSGEVKLTFAREIQTKEQMTYETEEKESSEVYKGETKVSQEGKMGVVKATTKYVYQDNQIAEREELGVVVEEEPVKKIVLVGTKEKPAATTTTTAKNNGGGSTSSGNNSGGGSSSGGGGSIGGITFGYPVSGGYISSYYGTRNGKLHKGIDIAASTGTPIYAAAGGTVTFSGWDGSGYGNMIVINHGNGVQTRYAHNNSNSVSNGQSVSKGQQIGTVGNTGNSTGPHCHFEIIINGSTVDPMKYL